MEYLNKFFCHHWKQWLTHFFVSFSIQVSLVTHMVCNTTLTQLKDISKHLIFIDKIWSLVLLFINNINHRKPCAFSSALPRLVIFQCVSAQLSTEEPFCEQWQQNGNKLCKLLLWALSYLLYLACHHFMMIYIVFVCIK